MTEAGARMAMINLGAEWSPDGVVADATLLNLDGDVITGESVRNLAIASMRDLTGRLPAGHNVPVLNDQKVIAAARHKDQFYRDFADFTTPAISFASRAGAAEALVDLPAGDVVVKPSVGNEGNGIFIGSKADAFGFYIEQPEGTMYVAQSRLDTSRLPSSLKGLTDEDSALLAAEGSKEIRLFASNFEFVPVMRVAAGTDHQGKDVYVFVDPDSVPSEVYEVGRSAMSRLMQVSGVDEIHATVDMTYNPEGDGLEFPLMEINVKQPSLPTREENEWASTTVRRNETDQLQRMAGIAG